MDLLAAVVLMQRMDPIRGGKGPEEPAAMEVHASPLREVREFPPELHPLAAADLDADGRDEILFEDVRTEEIWVALGTPEGPADPVRFVDLPRRKGLLLGDEDGDGLVRVLVRNQDGHNSANITPREHPFLVLEIPADGIVRSPRQLTLRRREQFLGPHWDLHGLDDLVLWWWDDLEDQLPVGTWRDSSIVAWQGTWWQGGPPLTWFRSAGAGIACGNGGCWNIFTPEYLFENVAEGAPLGRRWAIHNLDAVSYLCFPADPDGDRVLQWVSQRTEWHDDVQPACLFDVVKPTPLPPEDSLLGRARRLVLDFLGSD